MTKSKIEMISISKKEFNKIVNQAYIEGYDSGRRAEKLENLLSNVTPNEIRAVFGLQPI